MASSTLSQSPYLRLVAGAFSSLAFGLGVNAVISPSSALQLFQFHAPASNADKRLVYNLLRVYGARDIAFGIAGAIAAYWGDVKSLAGIMIAGSVIATVDGFVSKNQIGRGQWNHWGFVPVSLGLGGALLGVFDRT